MTIETKIQKIGNSYGIILPEGVLQKLNISEGSIIYITENQGNAVKLTCSNSAFAEKSKMVDSIIKRYPDTLSELAK
ncbi:MAG: putative addiction module antidote [Cryomorphaceae bacterium]|jgi:putative addiction module antidote